MSKTRGMENKIVCAFAFQESGMPIVQPKGSKFKWKMKIGDIASVESLFGYGDYIADGHGYSDYTNLDSRRLEKKLAENPDIPDGKEWYRNPPYSYSSEGALKTKEERDAYVNQMKEIFKEKGRVVWLPIISIESYQVAEALHLYTDADYEAVLGKMIPSWFRSVGIEPKNTLWLADYHNNTDNPHIHLMMMEKKPTRFFQDGRERGLFSATETDKFREQFYKAAVTRVRMMNVSEEDREEFIKNLKYKDSITKQMRNNVSRFLTNSSDELLSKKIITLYETMDKKGITEGSLKLNSSQMKGVRKQVLNVVDDILAHPQNRDLYESCKLSWQKLDKLSANAEAFVTKEDEKLRETLANNLLQRKKEYDAYGRFVESIDKDKKKVYVERAEAKRERIFYDSREFSVSLMQHNQSVLEGEVQWDEHVKGEGYSNKGLVTINISLKENDEFNTQAKTLLESFAEDNQFFRTNRIKEDTKAISITQREKPYQKNWKGKKDGWRNVAKYSQGLLCSYLNCCLNNLQDGKESLEDLTKRVNELKQSKDAIELQKAMRKYVYENKDQPNNPYYRSPYHKKSDYKRFCRIHKVDNLVSKDINVNDSTQSLGTALASALNQMGRASKHLGREVRNDIDNYWYKEMLKSKRRVEEKEREEKYGISIN